MEQKKIDIITKKLDDNYKDFCATTNDFIHKIDGYHNVTLPYLEENGLIKNPEVQKYLKAFEEAKETALKMLKELAENGDVEELLKSRDIATLSEPLSASGKLIEKN